MNRPWGSITLLVLLFSSLAACTVTGPEIRIRPPIQIDVDLDTHHHHRHNHDD